MKLKRIEDFKKGWFIGDFEPNILKTKDFEIGIRYHKAGEDYERHYQEIATEYNVLIRGVMEIKVSLLGSYFNEYSKFLTAGDIFVIEPKEIVKPWFYSNCTVVCIKVPSIPNDKVVIHDNSHSS